MAEVWQTYGSWVLYGLFIIAFLWIHGRMHGGASQLWRDDDNAKRIAQDGQTQSTLPGESGAHAHTGHEADGHAHRHGDACC
jgi:hypothetical protein